ncbi:MAG: LysR family transcriptional regulator [Bacilli bacterium]|nr:LysR family transcriptional regulator [Bacilli bacterium]
MYNSNLNLNLYKIFYDVAQYGSVSTASKNLMISQPAISRSIKKLEEDLNVTLFYRTLNGMILTEKGKELLGYVEDACNSLRIGERTMMEANNLIKGKLSIGVPSHIASFYIFDKIRKFHKDYPNIEVSIISRCTAELIKLLENHEIDFVIDTSPICGNEKELHIEELIHCPHCFVSLASDNYDNVKSIKDLEEVPLILPIMLTSHRKRLHEIELENGVNFKNVLSIETSEMIREAVLNGNGVGYILKDVVQKDIDAGKLKVLSVKEELPFVTVNLVYIDKYLMNAPKEFIDKYLKK